MFPIKVLTNEDKISVYDTTFIAVNLGIIMHTTLIYAGFVLSEYIILIYAGSVFCGTACRCKSRKVIENALDG